MAKTSSHVKRAEIPEEQQKQNVLYNISLLLLFLTKSFNNPKLKKKKNYGQE